MCEKLRCDLGSGGQQPLHVHTSALAQGKKTPIRGCVWEYSTVNCAQHLGPNGSEVRFLSASWTE